MDTVIYSVYSPSKIFRPSTVKYDDSTWISFNRGDGIIKDCASKIGNDIPCDLKDFPVYPDNDIGIHMGIYCDIEDHMAYHSES